VLRYANFYDAQPGSRFGPRYISDFQILLVQSGTGHASIAGRNFDLAAGDLVFYGPNECHAVTSSIRAPLRLIALHFVFRQEDATGINAEFNAWSQAEPFTFEQGVPACPLNPTPPLLTRPAGAALRASIEALVLSYIASPAGRPIEKRGLMLLMLDEWRLAFENPDAHSRSHPAVSVALWKLSSQIDAPPSLEQLAKSASLSAGHFGRLFKQTTGLSVRQYINKQRLIEARRLLIQGDLNVAEVAQAVGFDDPFYFSRVFRIAFGISPSQFRGRYPLL
jgi:AraC-like DNA-binding protein